MPTDRTASQAYVPTSVRLARMLDRAEQEAVVSIAWLMAQLGRRSFGLTLLVTAVLGFLPGASTGAGLLVARLSGRMMAGHGAAALPRLVRGRPHPGQR